MARGSFAAALAFLSILPLAAAHSEEFVVIQSSLAALPAGTAVGPDRTLDVPARGRIVVLGASGRVVAVDGPFHGKLPADTGPSSSPELKAIAELFGNKDPRTADVGTMRAAEPGWVRGVVTTPAEAMAVDASDGGDQCLYDPASAEVMHDPASPGVMTVQSMMSGERATLVWDKGAVRQPWPAAVPLRDGASYLFQQGQESPAVAVLHLLAQAPRNEVDRVAQVAGMGCTEQARLLLGLIAQRAK